MGNGETVLVVDDEEAVLALVSQVLEGAGYQVLRARHSDEALDICALFKGQIPLLLTDVKMDPFMTGFQLAQCVRLMRADIKVLYISGYVENEMVQWEIETKVAHFLPKPFTSGKLLEMVRTALDTPLYHY